MAWTEKDVEDLLKRGSSKAEDGSAGSAWTSDDVDKLLRGESVNKQQNSPASQAGLFFNVGPTQEERRQSAGRYRPVTNEEFNAMPEEERRQSNYDYTSYLLTGGGNFSQEDEKQLNSLASRLRSPMAQRSDQYDAVKAEYDALLQIRENARTSNADKIQEYIDIKDRIGNYENRDAVRGMQNAGIYDESTDLQTLKERRNQLKAELGPVLPSAGQRFASGVGESFGDLITSIPRVYETAKQGIENLKTINGDEELKTAYEERRRLGHDQRTGQDNADAINALTQQLADGGGLKPTEYSDWIQESTQNMQALERERNFARTEGEQFLANTGKSVLENAARLPFGSAVSLGTMAMQSAAGRMQELSEQGVPAQQAFARGAVSGSIEVLTEKIGLDNVYKIIGGGGSGILADLVSQSLSEGGEEGLSYLLNAIADYAVNDPNAEWSWGEFLSSIAGGALSGAMMGGPASIIGSFAQNTTENTPNSTETAQTGPQEAPTAYRYDETERGGETTPVDEQALAAAQDAQAQSAEEARAEQLRAQNEAAAREVEDALAFNRELRDVIDEVQQQALPAQTAQMLRDEAELTAMEQRIAKAESEKAYVPKTTEADGGLEEYRSKLEEAKNMAANGEPASVIFNKTGWFHTGENNWRYGFDNTLPSGESADIILAKDGEVNGSEPGRLDLRADTSSRGVEDELAGDNADSRGADAPVRRSWERLSEEERSLAKTNLRDIAGDKNEELNLAIEAIGGYDALAERIYSDYVKGNVVAEQWKSLIPGIDKVISGFDGLQTQEAAAEAPALDDALLRQAAREINPYMSEEELDAFVEEARQAMSAPEQQAAPVTVSATERADHPFLRNLSKLYGINIVVADVNAPGGGTLADGSASYNAATNTMTFSPGATQAQVVRGVIMHELTHYIEQSEAYKEYADFVLKTMYPDATQLRLATLEMTADRMDAGQTLTEEEARRELVAEYTRNKLTDAVSVNKFVRGKPAVAARVLEGIKTVIAHVERWFGYNADLDALNELKTARRLFEAALEQTKSAGTKAGAGEQYEIVTTTKGYKYVKADRKVIKNKTPNGWARDVEDYINNEIRKGRDVKFTGIDGDELTITADTAGKARFRNEVVDSNGIRRPMTDAEFAAKLNAEAHIDELAQVSKRGNKIVPDNKGHLFSKDGFNYRKAYFEDFDGQYYEITLSVGKNGRVNTIYNVGKMKKRTKPANFVAQRPSNLSTANRVSSASYYAQNSEKVNTEQNYIPKGSEAARADADYMDAVERGDTETQQRMVDEAAAKACGNSKVRLDADGTYWYGEGELVPVYHATDSEKFNIFDRAKLGAKTDSNAFDESLAKTAHVGFWFNTKDLSKENIGNRAERVFLNIENPTEFGSVEALATDIYDKADEDVEAYLNYLEWNDIDGVVITNDEEVGGTSFVALNSNQIKSADPVTYDDAGNVIPLSQRFNEKNNDIRYSAESDRRSADMQRLMERYNELAAENAQTKTRTELEQERGPQAETELQEIDRRAENERLTHPLQRRASGKEAELVSPLNSTEYRDMMSDVREGNAGIIETPVNDTDFVRAQSITGNTGAFNSFKPLARVLDMAASKGAAQSALDFQTRQIKAAERNVRYYEMELRTAPKADTAQELGFAKQALAQQEARYLQLKKAIDDGSYTKGLREWLADRIEKPLYKAKAQYTKYAEERLDALHQYAVVEKGIRAGTKESAAVQWYGEGKRQIDPSGNSNEVEFEPYDLEKLRQEFPDKWQDIVDVAKYCRKVYDGYIDEINDALRKVYPDTEEQAEADLKRRENAVDIARRNVARYEREFANDLQADTMELLADAKQRLAEQQTKLSEFKASLENGDYFRNKRLMPRDDYFHHFKEMECGLGGIKNILGMDQNIDSTLAGQSAFTKPKSKWTSWLQQRKGGAYTEDAIGGLVKYIPAAEYKRFIEPYIAEQRGFIKNLAESTSETKNANGFINWMTNWVNDLAGKTNPMDRWLQGETDRTAFKALRWVNNRVKSNAVLGNLNSAIAQFANIPNATALVTSPKAWAKGARSYVNYVAELINGKTDAHDVIAQSDFFRERYLDTSIDRFAEKTLKSRTEDFAKAMLEFGDKEATRLIWYAAYEDGQAKGVKDPVYYADRITQKAVAGRGIGETPLGEKSEITKFFAPFQVEVNNQWQLYKELAGSKKLGLKGNPKGLLTLVVMSYLMNLLFKEVAGRDILPDFFGALLDSLSDTAKDEDAGVLDYVDNAAGRLAGETLSAMPYGTQIGNLITGGDSTRAEQVFGDSDPTRFGTGNIGLSMIADPILDIAAGREPDLLTPITSLVMPFGGKQLARTITGAQDLGYLPEGYGGLPLGFDTQDFAGSYSDSGRLRFPIDRSDPMNVINALTLGSFATKEGREYLENGAKPYSDSRTSKIEQAAGGGIDIEDYMQYFNALPDGSPSQAETKASIDSLSGLSTQQKAFIWAVENPSWSPKNNPYIPGYTIP